MVGCVFCLVWFGPRGSNQAINLVEIIQQLMRLYSHLDLSERKEAGVLAKTFFIKHFEVTSRPE